MTSGAKVALLQSLLNITDSVSPREAQSMVKFLADHVQARLLEQHTVVFGAEPSQTIASVP